MRKILFDEAVERIKEIGADQVWAALPYLGQQKTTERFSTKDFASIFRLQYNSGGFSEACVSMEEFLQYLVEFVPNLKELEIKDPIMAYPDSEREMFQKIRLQPLATDLLLKMENLTRVSIIEVTITFTEFVRVCRESRYLQCIQANNILVDVVPIHSLGYILETLASKFDYRVYIEREFPRKIHIFLRETNNVKPLQEAKVILSSDFFDLIPIGMTHLQIYDRKRIDFQNERHRLLRNLRRVGGTLKDLTLVDLRQELKITFRHIFELCQDLENLSVVDSYLSLEDPIVSFGQLKRFIWTNRIYGEELQYSTLQLDRILSAPHLQDIFISTNLILDLGDIRSLLNRIRNRMILTNLTKMNIYYYVHRKSQCFKEAELSHLAIELRSLGCDASVSIYRLP
ncbi:uncharacterized protein LOC135934366 [Cloeon dipterum]|uniref:uncharacterized protein LOC135934366 n=1 Tax=Cloeon dipterum TaxID=197152 RepID=UPI00322004F0